MDAQTETYLKGLLALEPEALNDEQIAFLRARRSYLTGEQAEKFAGVLEEGKQEVELEAKSRKELDEIAVSLGLDPKDYPNKGAIAAAIKEKQSQ